MNYASPAHIYLKKGWNSLSSFQRDMTEECPLSLLKGSQRRQPLPKILTTKAFMKPLAHFIPKSDRQTSSQIENIFPGHQTDRRGILLARRVIGFNDSHPRATIHSHRTSPGIQYSSIHEDPNNRFGRCSHNTTSQQVNKTLSPSVLIPVWKTLFSVAPN
ncbi:hypothetical protein J6590_087427 [Homalodisca vitripennis]|nr:hypothetical protein J6590_087427 [Homalodisca vitripennis]